MNIILPILAAVLFTFIVVLYVKGKCDAQTFDGELRFVMWKVRSLPVELQYFKHLEAEFERLYKMKRKDREHISVAWCEFARRYIKFFPELGDEAIIKNVE